MKLRRYIEFFIMTCGLFCLAPSMPRAEQFEPPAYVESILHDGEGIPLSFPSFVFCDHNKNELYVIDSRDRVVIYAADLFPLAALTSKDGIEAPQGLAVDGNGNVYVSMSASRSNPRNRISVFNASLKWDHDIYFSGFDGADAFSPYHLAADRQGKIYVTGYYKEVVLVIDSKGQLLHLISPEEEGKKVNINSVTVDKTGRIYLVSAEAGRVFVYDSNRKFLFKFGVKGGTSAHLSIAGAAGVDDRNGRIYVLDTMRNSVNVYDRDGGYISEFGGLGWQEGWFQQPKHITVDSRGRIMVADTFNNRVQVFQAK